MVRFALVGVVNTLIDVTLFLLLHAPLGITAANFVSTSTGMTFSFVVNGLFTFRADRLTLRHAALFLLTTGSVMWLLQPLVIHLGLAVADAIGLDHSAGWVVLLVKLGAVGVCFVANFLGYRHVVWRDREVRGVRNGRRP